MRKLVVVLNVIIALYFFVLANFYFWGSFFTGLVALGYLQVPPWMLFVDMLLVAPFLIYGTIMFFRKTEKKYAYGLILLLIIFLKTQIYSFFFFTAHKLEMADLSLNLVLFGVPLLIVYLTKYLNTKYVSGH